MLTGPPGDARTGGDGRRGKSASLIYGIARLTWGRRRIWIVLGTILMTVAFAIMALAPSLMMATVG